jgi:hypothetical protein
VNLQSQQFSKLFISKEKILILFKNESLFEFLLLFQLKFDIIFFEKDLLEKILQKILLLG